MGTEESTEAELGTESAPQEIEDEPKSTPTKPPGYDDPSQANYKWKVNTYKGCRMNVGFAVPVKEAGSENVKYTTHGLPVVQDDGDSGYELPDQSELLSLETIRTAYPKCLPRGKKELYLVDDEFEEIFGMTKTEFKELPKWKRSNLRRDKKDVFKPE